MKKFIFLLALSLPFSSFAAGNIDTGKTLFTARCGSCHSVGPSARGGFGPQLNGIVGRRVGASSDYAYSAAMKNAGLVWNEKNLSAFIDSPSTVVPGTKMRFWGISDKQQREDLIAYLKQFKQLQAP